MTVAQILAWADDHHARTGRWPNSDSGTVLANPNETWKAVGLALMRGGRGLDERITLGRLLTRERGVRNKQALPTLTEDQILQWAQAHQQETGEWPTEDSGPVAAAPGEKWFNIDAFLRRGGRGLPGGDSLPRLLARRLGIYNRTCMRDLSLEQVLTWADAHRARTGAWPHTRSGAVVDAPVEDWHRIDEALRLGHRGLPNSGSLARLLSEHRGVRNPVHPPPLTVRQILIWADAHHRRTGRWPGQNSGSVSGAEGENWHGIDSALRNGMRGLPGGSSLARLLAEYRGKRNPSCLPRLSIAQILEWADAHHERTGRWPSNGSGPLADAPGESWGAIEACLWQGLRGLPGGDSLARLLDGHRRGRPERR